MNEQRRIVYEYRDQVLEGKDMGGPAREEIGNVIERLVDEYTPGDFIEEWDLDGLSTALDDIFPRRARRPTTCRPSRSTARSSSACSTRTPSSSTTRARSELGEELMRALERYLLLQIIDQRWREHLYDMDYLREGIHLRGFAQIEPIVAYKNEAFDALHRPDEHHLVGLLAHDLQRRGRGGRRRRRGPRAALRDRRQPDAPRQASPTPAAGRPSPARWPLPRRAATRRDAAEEYDGEEYEMPAPVEQRVLSEDEQIGRNDPCWCGSGKKFKKCHGR